MTTQTQQKMPLASDNSVYTTGAFLVPRKIKIEGAEKWEWRWVVSDFGIDGDEYRNGEEIFLNESADDISGLIKQEDADSSEK